jgi:hypothetical protein
VVLREHVEGADRADHDAVVAGADEAADPVARPAVVCEHALLDALPVRVLEQAAGDAAVRPASGGDGSFTAADATKRELKEFAAAITLGQDGQIVAHPLLLRVHV